MDKTHINKIADKIIFDKTKVEKATPQESYSLISTDTTTTPAQDESPIDKSTEGTTLEPIDPNTASLDELLQIGLSKYAANNLLKYRSKGGRIKEVKDMLKIYGIDSVLYSSISPFIFVPTSNQTDLSGQKLDTISKIKKRQLEQVDTTNAIYHEPKALVDINTASEEELQTVYGIGPVISKGIISYRERLGGYNSLDQIKEIYGVKEEAFENIRSQLTLSGEIKKIYVPALSFKEILKHPYADYETTKMLKNIYFEIYDDKIKELISENMVDPRLVPYLHLDIPKEFLRN